MTLAINKVDGHGLSTTVCCACLVKKDKVDAILTIEGGV